MQRPTVKDIAQEADVSIATVSRVLNNHANINEEIRQRVLSAAEELGYEKYEKPERGRGKSLKEIGFVLAHSGADNPDMFWLPVLQGAETEASKGHIRLTYQGVSADIDSAELVSKIQEMRVDGLLLVGPFTSEAVRSVQQLNIPCVLIDNYVRSTNKPLDAVLANNVEGIKDAVREVISKGHHNIAFVGGHTCTAQDIYTFRQRKMGYLEALAEAGLPVVNDLLLEVDVTSSQEIDAACQRLLASGTPFSAVICVNDPTAGHVANALRKYHKRIPEDISILGFDDIAIATYMTPALTTVHVPTATMGATAVKRLLERYADPDSAAVTSLIDVYLVHRNSVVATKSS
jgi:DNA-binding LacI/PurR family transcriptional regulator